MRKVGDSHTSKHYFFKRVRKSILSASVAYAEYGFLAFWTCSVRSACFRRAESTTFAPGTKTRMWYFRPGYGEIVYYAPREKKT